MKNLIAITSPQMIPDEAYLIEAAFDAGVDLLHIRKPCVSRCEVEELLSNIPTHLHTRLSLHDCHELAQTYNVGGLHLNRRNRSIPYDWQGRISRSCHSLHEVTAYKSNCNYLFLSPIFDSVSKPGYNATFTPDELHNATYQGIIDSKVIALGGITPDNVDKVPAYGFGGVAVLGCLWKLTDIESIKQIVKSLKYSLTCYNL